ncbi:chromosome partitioning protein ParB, partial [Escherichia coli]|nr:chromosome partitioning protein ParB [Escherichia coli]
AKRIKDEMEKGPLTGSHQNDELGAGNTDEQSLNSGGDGTSEQTGNDDLNLAQEELEGGKNSNGQDDDDEDPLRDEEGEHKDPVKQPDNSGKD